MSILSQEIERVHIICLLTEEKLIMNSKQKLTLSINHTMEQKTVITTFNTLATMIESLTISINKIENRLAKLEKNRKPEGDIIPGNILQNWSDENKQKLLRDKVLIWSRTDGSIIVTYIDNLKLLKYKIYCGSIADVIANKSPLIQGPKDTSNVIFSDKKLYYSFDPSDVPFLINK